MSTGKLEEPDGCSNRIVSHSFKNLLRYATSVTIKFILA